MLYVTEINARIGEGQFNRAARIFLGMESLLMRWEGFVRMDFIVERQRHYGELKVFWESEADRDSFGTQALGNVVEQLKPCFEGEPDILQSEVVVEADRRVRRVDYRAMREP